MRLLMPLLLSFLFFSTSAQVSIVIEDETQSGFLLGLNNYVQNTEAVELLMIEGMDTIPQQLHFSLGNKISFTRGLHLREPGIYKYIITTNSRDELQLRYRGKLSSKPEGILSMSPQHILPLAGSAKIVTATVKSSESPTVPPAPKSKIKKEEAAKEIIKTKEVQEVKELKQDTNIASSPVAQGHVDEKKPSTSPPPVPKRGAAAPKGFEAFRADLQKTEFEFEKLQKCESYARQHNFTTSELKEVFGLLKYDNSRLQLLKSLQGQLSKMKDVSTLASSFDYEISKRQFEEIISK